MSIDHERIEAALARHAKACLQISGGKDSLATLQVMRPYWGRITVAWLDTGDAPRETHEQMQRIAAEVPHFLHVRGDQPGVIAAHGIPMDLLPPSAQQFGDIMHPRAVPLQGRYQCCARVLWNPLQQAMDDGGFTLLIRGQKSSDGLRPSFSSGFCDEEGREVLFPIEHWTDDDVLTFLEAQSIELPAYYKHGRSNIDCCTCPAYLGEFKRGAYIASHEPEKLPLLRQRVALAASLIGSEAGALIAEQYGFSSDHKGRNAL